MKYIRYFQNGTDLTHKEQNYWFNFHFIWNILHHLFVLFKTAAVGSKPIFYCQIFQSGFIQLLWDVWNCFRNFAANSYEKAKSNVWQSIFSFPLYMLMFIAAFGSLDTSDIKLYKIVTILLSFVLILWSMWSFFAGLKILKEFHKKK